MLRTTGRLSTTSGGAVAACEPPAPLPDCGPSRALCSALAPACFKLSRIVVQLWPEAGTPTPAATTSAATVNAMVLGRKRLLLSAGKATRAGLTGARRSA
jgi:hypothetical protein